MTPCECMSEECHPMATPCDRDATAFIEPRKLGLYSTRQFVAVCDECAEEYLREKEKS